MSSLPSISPTVQLEHVEKRNSENFSLRLTVSFTAGTTILIGANGAGKSTLMRILATAERPDLGDYLINGVSTLTRSGRAYARQLIGWLPQVFGYDPGCTALEYMQYMGWLRGLRGKQLQVACNDALELVSLTRVARVQLRKLSGGMLRRLGIAQAVVASPRVLLLDEPTAGLDPKQRDDLYAVIREASRSRVVVCATHLIEDLDYLADSVLLLSHGSTSGLSDYSALLENVGKANVRQYLLDYMREGQDGPEKNELSGDHTL